ARAPRARGAAPAPVSMGAPARERVALAPLAVPEDTPAEARAWSMALEGVVRDAAGRPAAGVPVRVGREDAEAGESAARSDAHGRFRLADVDGRSWIWAQGSACMPSNRHFAASVDP